MLVREAPVGASRRLGPRRRDRHGGRGVALPGTTPKKGAHGGNLVSPMKRAQRSCATRSRGDRIRTCDLRFWRPPLYQLSYAPVPAPVYRDGFRVYGRGMAMTGLFAVLAAALAAVSAYAFASGTGAPHLLVGAAAAAVALWLASVSRAAFRRRR